MRFLGRWGEGGRERERVRNWRLGNLERKMGLMVRWMDGWMDGWIDSYWERRDGWIQVKRRNL